jgi:hypothetical protein
MAVLLAATSCWLLAVVPASAVAEGIHNIQHVVMVAQENRSFDSYFGTYPGANGTPPGVCEPHPLNRRCVAPFHDAEATRFGATPHCVLGFGGPSAMIRISRQPTSRGQSCSPANALSERDNQPFLVPAPGPSA